MYRIAFNHGLWSPVRDHLVHIFRCISRTEQNTAIRYAYQRDIKAYMIARLLILYVLKRHFLLDPVDVHVERTPEGRPHLPSHQDFDFNVSHNGDYTVLAACTNGRVGVDVMRIELPQFGISANRFLLKMKNIFAASEWNFLMSDVSDTAKMQRFFRLWCLKEAYVKALGVGLSIDLQTVEFQLSNALPNCVCAEPLHWTFEEHTLGPNHVTAIAWNIPGSPVLSQGTWQGRGSNPDNPEDKTTRYPFRWGVKKVSSTVDMTSLYSHFRTPSPTEGLGSSRPEPEEFETLSYEELIADLHPFNDVSPDLWSEFLAKDSSPPSSRRILS